MTLFFPGYGLTILLYINVLPEFILNKLKADSFHSTSWSLGSLRPNFLTLGCLGRADPLYVQWAWKVSAAVAENYSTSKYYILGQIRDRKAPFSAFDAVCAGLFHDKILATYNL